MGLILGQRGKKVKTQRYEDLQICDGGRQINWMSLKGDEQQVVFGGTIRQVRFSTVGLTVTSRHLSPGLGDRLKALFGVLPYLPRREEGKEHKERAK